MTRVSNYTEDFNLDSQHATRRIVVRLERPHTSGPEHASDQRRNYKVQHTLYGRYLKVTLWTTAKQVTEDI